MTQNNEEMPSWKKILKVWGKLGVLLMIAVVLNRSEWYQKLNPMTSMSDIYVWAFSLGFVISFLWILNDFIFKEGGTKDE